MSKIIYRTPTPVLFSKNVYEPSQECWTREHLKVKAIQEITTGKGAQMCFLDDGIAANQELKGRIKSPRFSYLPDSEFYGSHSTLGATIVGGTTLGIFPDLEFISKQVLYPDKNYGSASAVISAIYNAKDKGISCINLSLGSDSPDPQMEKALKHYCSNGKNIATIAAGNDAKNTDYPAQYAKKIDGVLAIAATQISAEGEVSIAFFSSYGVITLAAPGHELKSMDHTNRIDFVSGTSFAAPIVGATIAVAQQLRPGVSQLEILSVLKETANHPKNDPPRNGFGEIDILSFLKRIKDPTPIKILKKPITKLSWWQKLKAFS